MNVLSDVADPKLAKVLLAGGVVILRTDTLYGIVARAADQQAVERVYAAKDRDLAKSPIVLISSFSQLFDVPSEEEKIYLQTVWPGTVSVILPSIRAPEWLRRSNHSIAYRMPDDEKLRALIEKTGPLIAPSANPEGEIPARNIDEAIDYFGDQIDAYVDGGHVEDDTPSQLVKFSSDGNMEILR